MVIYWHWRRLYNLVHVTTPDDRLAMWLTVRLIRAKLRVDVNHEPVTTRHI